MHTEQQSWDIRAPATKCLNTLCDAMIARIQGDTAPSYHCRRCATEINAAPGAHGYAALWLWSDGLRWAGYTQFLSSSWYLREIKRFESKEAALEAIEAARKSGRKGIRLATWQEATERLL